ncbi:MAG: hypothetical protein C4583_01505 [Anaerolineaceae bacterium]|nr:MAG: hypothetical protein C4583_01505 [Anaerolineaceae bacterium]
MKTTNRRNLFILVFALLVVMLGFGMVIPVFPFLIDKLGASGSALGILVATRQIQDGQTITADGGTGTVELK